MKEIIESYINGNIAQAKSVITSGVYTFNELFECYVKEYSPNMGDVKLFIKRLS